MIVGEVVESETFTKVHDTLLIQSNFLLHGCLCFQFLHQTFACKQKTMLMGYLHFVIVILELTFPALIEQVYWLRPLPYSIGWAVCPEEQPARLEKLKKHYFGSYYINNSTLTKDLSNVTFCLWWKQHLIKILYESFSCLQNSKVPSCKLHNNKHMIASAQTRSPATTSVCFFCRNRQWWT